MWRSDSTVTDRGVPQVASEARDRLGIPAGRAGKRPRDAGAFQAACRPRPSTPARPPRPDAAPRASATSGAPIRSRGGPDSRTAMAVRSPSLARGHPEGRPLRSACTALIAAQDPASDADPRSGRRAHRGLSIIGLVPASDYA